MSRCKCCLILYNFTFINACWVYYSHDKIVVLDQFFFWKIIIKNDVLWTKKTHRWYEYSIQTIPSPSSINFLFRLHFFFVSKKFIAHFIYQRDGPQWQLTHRKSLDYVIDVTITLIIYKKYMDDYVMSRFHSLIVRT